MARSIYGGNITIDVKCSFTLARKLGAKEVKVDDIFEKKNDGTFKYFRVLMADWPKEMALRLWGWEVAPPVIGDHSFGPR